MYAYPTDELDAYLDKSGLVDELVILESRSRLWVDFEPQLWNRRGDYMTYANLWSTTLRRWADKASLEGNHQEAQARMKTAYHIAALAASEGSLTTYWAAHDNRREADFAVLLMMNRTSDLPSQKAWRSLIPDKPLVPDYRAVAEHGLLDTRHFNPFDPFYGPAPKGLDRDLLKRDLLHRRIVAHEWEYWNEFANLSADGRLTRAELDRLKQNTLGRARKEPLLARFVAGYANQHLPGFDTDDQEILHQQVLAAADALVEHAGGPKAPTRASITAERSFGQLNVIHASSKEILYVDVTRAGRFEDYNRKLE